MIVFYINPAQEPAEGQGLRALEVESSGLPPLSNPSQHGHPSVLHDFCVSSCFFSGRGQYLAKPPYKP